MDYSTTWFDAIATDGCTLLLLDDSPVRDSLNKVHVFSNVSNQVDTNLWLNDEAGALMEELKRVNAENKRLTEMLTVICENYNDLKRQLTDYMDNKSFSNEFGNAAKKRKVETWTNVTPNININVNNNNNNNSIGRNNVETSSSDEEDSCEKSKGETIKAKIKRVAIRTEASDSSLILKDGYQWRKYGQKVTRDNPCPRAYFKCSFAPTCPVKKKVQRSLEDQSMLVATYEGEHNHAPPAQQEAILGSSRGFNLGSVPCNTSLASSCPTVTLDLTKPKVTDTSVAIANVTNKTLFSNTASSQQVTKFNSPEFQKVLAEQMAFSLTKDPKFTTALAAAISGRFVHQSSTSD